MEEKLPERKPTRLGCFDYSTTGAYFVTICTENRRQILSNITQLTPAGDGKTLSCTVGEGLAPPAYRYKTNLTLCGKIAEQQLLMLEDRFQNLTVDQYVIMPDHVHIVLFVENGGSPRTSTPTRQTASVSHFVSTLKRFCNKEYGENVWQRGFYDHVIRGQEDYEEIVKYILENPARCYYGKLYTEE